METMSLAIVYKLVSFYSNTLNKYLTQTHLKHDFYISNPNKYERPRQTAAFNMFEKGVSAFLHISEVLKTPPM